ncbi:MAG: hypothetical protein IJH75_05255 [Mogibacterium sp.]|nr:hypothetical protein [Mogibacterium sp.]
MKRLRDFFHDNNDILLALVIVVVAAGLIVWRISIILDYPAQIAKENARQSQTEAAAEQDEPVSEEPAVQEETTSEEPVTEGTSAEAEEPEAPVAEGEGQ